MHKVFMRQIIRLWWEKAEKMWIMGKVLPEQTGRLHSAEVSISQLHLQNQSDRSQSPLWFCGRGRPDSQLYVGREKIIHFHHNTEEMSKAREQTPPSFTTYCDSSGTKTVTLAEEQNMSKEQNGKPRNRLHKCSQLISDTGVKLSQCRKGSPFSKRCWDD